MPTEIHNAAIADSPLANQEVNTTSSVTFAKVTLPTGAAGITGTAVLSSGTVTVSTTAVTANSKVLLTWNGTGTLTGILKRGTIVAGTSFVIASTAGTDNAQVDWLILN